MSWSMSQGVAAYLASCAGGVNVTNLRTRQTRVLASAQEPALSSAGILAVVDRPNTPSLFQEGVVRLVNPHTGAVLHTVARGELPTWSRDGRTLSFVQRRLLRTLHAKDGLGNQRDLRIFSSSIYRADATGTGLTRLLTEDAFGFGALNATPGGAIIFSRVDNDWAVWQHRKGNVIAPDQGKYAPKVQIQRLNVGGVLTTLALNAGQPMVG